MRERKVVWLDCDWSDPLRGWKVSVGPETTYLRPRPFFCGTGVAEWFTVPPAARRIWLGVSSRGGDVQCAVRGMRLLWRPVADEGRFRFDCTLYADAADALSIAATNAGAWSGCFWLECWHEEGK